MVRKLHERENLHLEWEVKQMDVRSEARAVFLSTNSHGKEAVIKVGRLKLKTALAGFLGEYVARDESASLFGQDTQPEMDRLLKAFKEAYLECMACGRQHVNEGARNTIWDTKEGESRRNRTSASSTLNDAPEALNIDSPSTHMDLLSVLPDFPTKPYAHILPPLERSKITTVDLITLDTLEIAKRAHVPPADVRRLCASLIKALHHDIGFENIEQPASADPSSSINDDLPITLGPTTKLDVTQWSPISTLDIALDELLGGGIPTRYVTEVTGESGSGKTQFLLTLLLAVQLPSPRGLGKNAIYISTEAPLSTPRLSQLKTSHPYLSTLPRDDAPSLENILSINAMDLESQEHILNYQLPVAIQRHNIGLVVIDSITSNYRAEHTAHNILGLSTRSGELTKLGQMLRNLAMQEDIAIIVANQVSDRFDAMENPSTFPRGAIPGTGSPSTQSQQPRDGGTASPIPRVRPTESGNIELPQHNALLPSSPSPFPSSPYTTEEDPHQQFDGSYIVGNPVRGEILSLLHQQRFFTGWGDTPQSQSFPVFQRPAQKTPALGLVWSTQIACRIALKKERPSATDPLLDSTPVPPTSTSTPTPQPDTDAPPEPDSPETAAPDPDPPRTESPEAKDVEPVHESKTSAPQPQPPSQILSRPVRRTMKLVFAPWTAGAIDSQNQNQIKDEVRFTIWKGGLRSCQE
ncbi:putative DNA repair protein (Rad57) [Aspergillus alliaceus]|uniref:putative DNA repair protein (Rad57) n=1 Tax=Petromyces alliaceus TaxID=209559 RepID=UPI0012A3B9EE|nr:uncharacterized protein BDW43DRAFT_312950 [Aspergillus alliaceus]KAB8231421.1 hypothetical protein BDW43DRAFT_312950 [Aspergillus alliaceus]